MLLFPCFLFPQSAEEIARRAEEWLRSYRTLQVDFKHLSFSAIVSTPMEEKGRLYLQNPGWMKWEYTDPEKKIFILKGDLYQEYFIEDKILQEQILSQDEEGMEILKLLTGQSGIQENYSIKISAFSAENENAHQLVLTPPGEEEEYTITLEIEKNTWRILRLMLVDWEGNRQEFQFSRFRINPVWPDDFFDLKVPDDVEIIKQVG